jgi:hypothetical protein
VDHARRREATAQGLSVQRRAKDARRGYPDVGLRDARHASESAKRLSATGLDPSRVRKSERAAKAEASANTFAIVAVELVDKKRREAMSDKTITKREWLIGLAVDRLRPIAEIKVPEILSALRTVESRGRLETARRHNGARKNSCFRLSARRPVA